MAKKVKEGILGSEWTGYYGKEYWPPKSFQNIGDKQRHYAFEGLFYLLGDIEDNTNIKSPEQKSVLSWNSYFFRYVILKTLKLLLLKLRIHLRPTYQTKIVNSSKSRGQLQFVPSLQANYGLQHKHVWKYSELTYDDPLLMFLKSAVAFMYHRLIGVLHKDNRNHLRKTVTLIEELLKDTRTAIDPLELATQLIYNNLSFDSKYSDILNEAKILAHFLLGSRLGPSTGIHSDKTDSILLNLNRPFERLVRTALDHVNHFHGDDSALNSMRFRQHNGQLHNLKGMIPDCRGEFRGQYLILDVKHKFPVGNVTGGSPSLVDLSINRSDLYQIISYARTNYRQNITSRYGLVYLNQEIGTESDFVDHLGTVAITYGPTLEIEILTLNFGAALSEIGAVIEKRGSPNTIFENIGAEITEKLKRSPQQLSGEAA